MTEVFVTEQWQALSALQAWESGGEVPGGLAFADELQAVDLDYSLASLGRIDAFLDALREQRPPPEAQFVGHPGQANLLRLLAWYAGELMGRAAGMPARWGELAGEVPSTLFRESAACRFGGGSAARFRPLQLICARLFGPGGGLLAGFRDYHARRFAERGLPEQAARLPPAPTPAWPTEFPGSRPVLSEQEITSLRVEVPPWDTHAQSTLAPLFEQHAELLRSGRVIWGALIAPDNVIGAPHFRGGLFLQLVYDVAGRVDPTTLEHLADRLYNEVLPSEEARRFIYSEHPRLGLAVPTEVSPYPLQMSGTFVPQDQLPDGLPTQIVLPLLIDPVRPDVVAVLPSHYWPQSLRSDWLAASEKRYGERIDASRLRQRSIDALADPAARQSMQQDLDFQMGAMYFHGANVQRDYARAREMWEQGSRGGNPFAMVALGVIHQNGFGTPIDVPRARRCFQSGLALGLELGDFELGRSFLVEGNTDMGRLHLQRAANRGYAPAAELLEKLSVQTEPRAAGVPASGGPKKSLLGLGAVCALCGTLLLGSTDAAGLAATLWIAAAVLFYLGLKRQPTG